MSKWRGVVSVIEIIVILVCVILLIFHFANKTSTLVENKKYAEQDNNGEINQTYALEYLNKYVDELLFSGYVNEKSEDYVEKDYSLVTPNIFSSLTNNDKLNLTLSYLVNIEEPLTKENVERKYNEYFNTKDIEYISVNGCSSYTYDDKDESYTLANKCNNNTSDKLMVYKASYVRDGQNGLATIYVGLKTDNGIFTDLEKSNYYETDNINDFTINNDNYKNFSKYVITFKEKDDSLYYFYSIAKAS